MPDGGKEEREPYLPSRYYLDETSEPGFVVLRRGDGSEVAWFSATGADGRWIEAKAWEHFGGRG